MSNSVVHKADSRGVANHGWLKAKHSFSFANYFNADRMHFGVLRVLNDDEIDGGMGFGTHPHDNMEIITIPLEGALEHRDSMGNSAVIQEGEIQVMSAGTGITHSEFNKNKEKPLKLLQIWVFPNKRNVTPRYDQISINDVAKPNEFYQILSPNAGDQGVWIHQDAWFSMGDLEKDVSTKYSIHKQGNGLYFFVIEGEIEVEGQKLYPRDGYGIWEATQVTVTSVTKAKVLLMELPMEL